MAPPPPRPLRPPPPSPPPGGGTARRRRPSPPASYSPAGGRPGGTPPPGAPPPPPSSCASPAKPVGAGSKRWTPPPTDNNGGQSTAGMETCREINDGKHAPPSITQKCTVLIIGAAGNVGAGIAEAFSQRHNWTVIGVDPNLPAESDANEGRGSSRQPILRLRRQIQEVDDDTFSGWFAPHPGGRACREVVYACEEGNPDRYTDACLGFLNEVDFDRFVQRVVASAKGMGTASNDDSQPAAKVHISYIGGSWTRRKISYDPLLNCLLPLSIDAPEDIDDYSTTEGHLRRSPTPYEVAKTFAWHGAHDLASLHAGLIAITFFDYISVVPNFAPNFSVSRMVRQAMEEGVIEYSEGDYGRPLLHRRQAGEVVATLAEQWAKKQSSGAGSRRFETVIVPGVFTTFGEFASVAREVVTARTGRDEICLQPLGDTPPDYLRARCTSNILEREIGFVGDRDMVREGLRDAAQHAVERLLREE